MSIQLYASSGNGGKATIGVPQLVSLINQNLELPAPTDSVRGGVLTQAGVTASGSTIANPAPAGGTGTAEGGWDTAVNRDTAIATINQTRTLALELQGKVNALISSLTSAGIIA